VSSAVVPKKNKSGGSWDNLDGAADPYLVAYSSLGSTSHEGETAIRDDTHTPYFGQAVLKGITAAELLNNLSFELWEADANFDDFIGGCSIKLTEASFNGYLSSVVCPPMASTVEVKLFYRIAHP
jgi:hypothetical protein